MSIGFQVVRLDNLEGGGFIVYYDVILLPPFLIKTNFDTKF